MANFTMANFTMAYPISNASQQDENVTMYISNKGHDANTDKYDETEEYFANLSWYFYMFSMVVYSLAFLLGTTGNGLVIFFTAFRMKRTVNVVWFLNLAIADFIFTLFLPLSITYVALDFYWPFGRFMCKLNSTIAFINLFASVFLLTVISIDRFISVVFPVWCQNHRTPRLAYVVVLVVWILALFFSLPFFIFRNTDNDDYCFNDFPSKAVHQATIIIRFIVGFLIPFALIVSCYSIIMLRIQRNHMTTSRKPFKIIVTVIISFFVCWFPYHVVAFLELASTYGGNDYLFYVSTVIIPLTSSLAFINSCINPIVYVFIGRDFKQKFWSSFQSIFEKAFMEESQTDLKSKTKSTSDSQLF